MLAGLGRPLGPAGAAAGRQEGAAPSRAVGGHGREPRRCLRSHRDAAREILKRLAVIEEGLKELELSAARGDDFEETMAMGESHFPGLESLDGAAGWYGAIHRLAHRASFDYPEGSAKWTL